MKFTAEQKQLAAVLTRAVAVTERRNTIPILAHVLVEAADGAVNFTATDLDLQIKERMATNVTANGALTVNAQMFKDIVAKLKDGDLITAWEDSGYLHIKSGRSNFKLQTLTANDFPKLASDEYKSEFSIPADILKSAFDRTVWAASTEETRYYLKGVAFQWREGNADFVATDGHRLGHYVVSGVPEFDNIIIPTKTVKQLSNVLFEGEATVSVSDTKLRVTYEDIEIVSKTIDGTYPDWTRVIPKDLPNKVTASSVELKGAVDRVSVVATQHTRAVKVSVGDGDLTISASDTSSGDASDTISAVVNGDAVVIGVNGKYALDAMAQADKGDVVIAYKGNMDPMLVTYDKEPSLRCVLMPMRLA